MNVQVEWPDHVPFIDQFSNLMKNPSKFFRVYRMREDGFIHSYYKTGEDLLVYFEGFVISESEIKRDDWGIIQEEYTRLVDFVDNSVAGTSVAIHLWVIVCCGDEKR